MYSKQLCYVNVYALQTCCAQMLCKKLAMFSLFLAHSSLMPRAAYQSRADASEHGKHEHAGLASKMQSAIIGKLQN